MNRMVRRPVSEDLVERAGSAGQRCLRSERVAKG